MRTAVGAVTAMIARLHTIAANTLPGSANGPPYVSDRTASMTIDTGWCSANHSNGAGIDDAATNAVDAKTNGARIGNDAAWAASAFDALRPTSANTHDSACANSRISASPARISNGVVCGRQPTM